MDVISVTDTKCKGHKEAWTNQSFVTLCVLSGKGRYLVAENLFLFLLGCLAVAIRRSDRG